MDILELIRLIIANGELERFRRSATPAQFGLGNEVYLGATILPEREVEGNIVEDENIRYRSVIANDAARYSPVQLKEGAALFGSMLAKLAESDIGKEFTAQQYDQLRRLLLGGGTFEQASRRFLGWFDREVFQALLRLDEKRRWQAIENAAVDRRGDNSYQETVAYPDPAGHRSAVLVDWDAVDVNGISINDPMDDIFAVMELAQSKGVRIARVIMSGATQLRLVSNTKFQDRARYGAAGYVPPNDSIIRGFPAIGDVATVFQRNGLPAPEIYDGTYEDFDEAGNTVRNRYLGEHKIVFVGTSDLQEEVAPLAGDTFFVGNTLGYTAIGTPQGEDDSGRVIKLKAFTDDKPYRIETKGWETSLPILEQPERLFCLDSEAPAA